MSSRRGAYILCTFTLLILLFVFRVFYLQVIAGPKLSKAAAAQRITNSEIDKPRGDILDKNGIPLTNRDKKISLIIKPLYLKGKEEEIKAIGQILGEDIVKLKREIEIKKEPIVFDIDESQKEQIQALNIESVSYVHSLKRYDENSVARHVLGYLNKIDQVGETGIEKQYEDALKYNKENRVSVVTDARNNVLQGFGYRINKSDGETEKLDIRLTLDYHIQKIVENVLKKNNITGAVVVEDVLTGDIAAIASAPDYEQNRIEKYLDSPGRELFNRAVASYNLGSIFKIIDVAQLFESKGFVDDKFFCEGFIKLGDKEFKCTSYEKGGHGWEGIKEAFAVSCNSYFITLGVKLGYKNLIGMAQRFGLGSVTGLKDQGINEAAGNLPLTKRYYTDGDVANISIGQGDVMATPLQVADLVATVANGGIKNRVNIVDAVVDYRGNIVRAVKKKEGVRILSKQTADEIKMLMEEVTASGTGLKANLDEYGGAGGKTGSAETGQFINGEKVVHAWFAGYFPKREPKYSISVFIENGKAGGQAAAPIFGAIAEEIMKNSY